MKSYSNGNWIIPVLAMILVFLSTACNSTKDFSGFSYDPEGATVTTDKSITLQHYRTIGIGADSLWISNEFDGSRMNNFFKVSDSLYRVVIEPENHPVNNSPWYAFKAWSQQPETVRLELFYRHGNHRYYPEISRDGKRWNLIDSTSFSEDTLAGTATLTLQLDSSPLWISGQELITMQKIYGWIDSLAAKPFIGQDTVGYTHQNRPLRKITITSAAENRSRGVVIITSRQHPPEVTGQIAFKAFIEEIVSESPLARKFREEFEVIAYPLMNPDGVQNGHWRHNGAGVDLNRDWQAFNQPETQSVRDDLLPLKRDSLRTVYYGIDFHSTDEDIFYPINREIETFPDDFTYRWLDALTASFPQDTFAVEPFDTGSPIAKNWIFHTFGADALTFEVNDVAKRGWLKEFSRSGARLLMEMLLEEKENLAPKD